MDDCKYIPSIKPKNMLRQLADFIMPSDTVSTSIYFHRFTYDLKFVQGIKIDYRESTSGFVTIISELQLLENLIIHVVDNYSYFRDFEEIFRTIAGKCSIEVIMSEV